MALVSACAACAQTSHAADRYADSYKVYLGASCPIPEDEISHFAYFARDRQAIRDHPFLDHDRFSGAQIVYPWAELETAEGEYDFTSIEEDYEYLKSRGKRLFVQLQDATFDPGYRAVPEYLLTDAYDGGAIQQVNDDGKAEGWVAKRWNSKVRDRFALLLGALGERFDGKIEGINLQETAIGVDAGRDGSLSPELYVEAIQANMRALLAAADSDRTGISVE